MTSHYIPAEVALHPKLRLGSADPGFLWELKKFTDPVKSPYLSPVANPGTDQMIRHEISMKYSSCSSDVL
jgi:hypothetical protein